MQILQLDIQGMPQRWISPQEAACHYATDSVSWTIGEVALTMRGGINASTGQQSVLDVHPIIAINGASAINLFDAVPGLSNAKLFRRDRMTCAYCGDVHDRLTRDHIIPVSRGGPDEWANVVAACRRCNAIKGAATPEEAGMPLLFAPYVPSVFEGFLLGGRNIRGDVHDWLAKRVGRESRWRPAE